MTPGPAAQLMILASGEPPAGVTAGQSFTMVIEAEDLFGNLATASTAR